MDSSSAHSLSSSKDCRPITRPPREHTHSGIVMVVQIGERNDGPAEQCFERRP